MSSHRADTATAPGATSNRVSVAVIGGGIGGLSAALSLLQTGVDVQV
jgi:cation diffusion facilitator CzcD-associated flavoprotein CzcO